MALYGWVALKSRENMHRSFVRSLVRSFVRSLMRSFTQWKGSGREIGGDLVIWPGRLTESGRVSKMGKHLGV